MWQSLALKLLWKLLGVLGYFVLDLVEEIQESGIANKLASRAKYHAKALAEEDLSKDQKREKLWKMVCLDAQDFGKQLKENAARRIAELAYGAAKKEFGLK